jgi:ribosomal protein S24E
MMSLKIVEKKKNPLLKREEVRALFEHQGKPTPPRKDILPPLEKALGAKKELILIDKIFSIKGKGESKLKVFVYSKKEDIPKDKLEVIQKRMEKAKKAKEKEPEEKPAEEAKPEEEAKEEPPKKEKEPEEKPKEGEKPEEKKEEKK